MGIYDTVSEKLGSVRDAAIAKLSVLDRARDKLVKYQETTIDTNLPRAARASRIHNTARMYGLLGVCALEGVKQAYLHGDSLQLLKTGAATGVAVALTKYVGIPVAKGVIDMRERQIMDGRTRIGNRRHWTSVVANNVASFAATTAVIMNLVASMYGVVAPQTGETIKDPLTLRPAVVEINDRLEEKLESFFDE